jgi:putative transposase
MRRKGACLDKAGAERFGGSLKRERTGHSPSATRQDVRDEVSDDIEMFYNSTRWHASLGYVRSNAYEAGLKAA